MNRAAISLRTPLAGAAIVVLAFGFRCFAQGTSRAAEDSLLAAAGDAFEGDIAAKESLEAKSLAAPHANAKRDSRGLVLQIKSGGSRVYADRPECRSNTAEASCQRYFLLAHLHVPGFYVVAKLRDEGAEFLLVDDRSGTETTVRGIPIFSPTGEHIAVFLSNDEVVGFAVQVWRRSGDRYVLDWSGSPETTGIYTSYKLVKWQSEGRIDLQADIDFEPPRPTATKHFELVHSDQTWNVVDLH